MENYNFIATHPSLKKLQKSKELKTLRELTNDIDENINGYVRTYKYYDQFYPPVSLQFLTALL
jgi:hypothetical protein